MKIGTLSSIALATMVLSNSALAATKISPPADAALINEERILYWLEKNGQLSPFADEATKKKALKAYINKKSFDTPKLGGEYGQKILDAEHMPRIALSTMEVPSKFNKQLVVSDYKSGNNVIHNTVKVLAIMIDFPDLPHDNNRLTASDTSMYYSSYDQSHYQDLLFSQTGYAGPSGQNIQSAYQFYQEESGQSLSFTGNAVGWVTADNNADTYGGNDDDGDDKDVPSLVLEAVTKAVANHQIDLTEYDKTDFLDIDGDGNINEPDGIIDHVMIFHSSVGEEAGGGVMGDDAIWSHRFYVFDENNQPVDVPGSEIRLFGYTINPIDAATGVVVHEFGHDLGVPDEYSTDNGQFSSPVSNWSVMASGSWVGSPAGTSPVSFSPYARDYFQNKYGGNWINQNTIDYSNLSQETINLVPATTHDSNINQVKIMLPPEQVAFGTPYAGDYQFYSQAGDLMSNNVSFDVTLPAETATLTMKARWDIELDWDYLQVRVDGVAIAGNHTKVTNTQHAQITDFITGKSLDIQGSEGDLGWVELSFDLSAYAGQSVTVSLDYITDQAVGGYGFVADEISIDTDATNVFSHGAEETTGYSLNGFVRIGEKVDGADHHYYVQLRDAVDTDIGLPSIDFHPGVLLWYNNNGVSNNKVNEHPGEVFTGVVDADQNLIKSSSGIIYNTSTQITDAAFRTTDHPVTSRDSQTTAVSMFDDTMDYSVPAQPESGIKLPFMGFKMNVDSISADDSAATITLTNSGMERVVATQNGLSVSFDLEADDVSDEDSIAWQMGDGTELTGRSIQHTYSAVGDYSVEVSYTAASGAKTVMKSVTVGDAVTGNIVANVTGLAVSVDANVSGGIGELTYRWNFGDDSDIVRSKTASHSYESQDSYDITLVVTDEANHQFTFTQNIDFGNLLTAQITRTVNNLSVSFNSIVNGGSSGYTYAWNFGDGNTSTEENPSHTYASAGTYNVELTVTDADGSTVSATNSVNVSAAVVTPPTTTPSTGSSGGGGGGTMAWLLIVIAAGLRRKVMLKK